MKLVFILRTARGTTRECRMWEPSLEHLLGSLRCRLLGDGLRKDDRLNRDSVELGVM